ncbi:hypothetical protein ACH427_22990 [Streptomyces sp. NPDC020379]|uniref:hypothetical protein n=1 Tax=Streptomyces sp. NPDC020379 TaxID=3365071 RepID=UPI0037B0EA83
MRNGSDGEQAKGRTTRVHEGPIPRTEVEDAAFGFVEPDCFPVAYDELKKGLLFLTGTPGSGRRTLALNLLRRCCGGTTSLRALDSVTELDRWRPTHPDARGYLMDGLFPSHPLKPGMLGNLRSLLDKAGACMVIVLPDDPHLLRGLEHDLHVRLVRCEPPSPRRVFDKRFEALVPDGSERSRLLGALESGLLQELLAPGLVPAEVAELVSAVVSADGNPDVLGSIQDRLSYRAEEEVPELIGRLRDDPDALAFLLAACVFEGLDHRIVREESDRLLELAAGRLASVVAPTGGENVGREPRPNPDFVFRRPLQELLHAVRAQREPRKIRAEGAYAHVVEPVTFVRHRQAEAVLRHVWREYGQLSELLVSWLREVDRNSELTQPVGRVMGMATAWGGGRRALRHIKALAESERTTSHLIAAHALGIAAEDPVLVAEVRYRLSGWSRARDSNLRATVALACGADFGLSRPDFALSLLRTLVAGVDKEARGSAVRFAVRAAISRLFQAGNERLVFEQLVEWLADERQGAESLLVLFPQLLQDPRWFQQELAGRTECGRQIIDMIRTALNSDVTFDATCWALLRWCDGGRWDEGLARAVEDLFAALASPMEHGALRLFVEVDRSDTEGLAGRDIARQALRGWRNGAAGHRSAHDGVFYESGTERGAA